MIMAYPVTGEFEDTALPSKKSFGTKNKEFLESKREAFESYIQVNVAIFFLVFSPKCFLLSTVGVGGRTGYKLCAYKLGAQLKFI